MAGQTTRGAHNDSDLTLNSRLPALSTKSRPRRWPSTRQPRRVRTRPPALGLARLNSGRRLAPSDCEYLSPGYCGATSSDEDVSRRSCWLQYRLVASSLVSVGSWTRLLPYLLLIYHTSRPSERRFGARQYSFYLLVVALLDRVLSLLVSAG